MAWIITEDKITEDAKDSAVGVGQGDLAGKTYEFRLYDDDGELYYVGKVDQIGVDDDTDEGGLYNAWLWGMSDSGTTELRMSAEAARTAGFRSTPGADQTSIYA